MSLHGLVPTNLHMASPSSFPLLTPKPLSQRKNCQWFFQIQPINPPLWKQTSDPRHSNTQVTCCKLERWLAVNCQDEVREGSATSLWTDSNSCQLLTRMKIASNNVNAHKTQSIGHNWLFLMTQFNLFQMMQWNICTYILSPEHKEIVRSL